eukprot:GILJ01014157.1.p1 GENE.GILJ01014157.1~~GILJ01014157.1.p1  ORF type:complete len:1929 (+),score=309.17 GILJ01014157.1:683-5788(+)
MEETTQTAVLQLLLQLKEGEIRWFSRSTEKKDKTQDPKDMKESSSDSLLSELLSLYVSTSGSEVYSLVSQIVHSRLQDLLGGFMSDSEQTVWLSNLTLESVSFFSKLLEQIAKQTAQSAAFETGIVSTSLSPFLLHALTSYRSIYSNSTTVTVYLTTVMFALALSSSDVQVFLESIRSQFIGDMEETIEVPKSKKQKVSKQPSTLNGCANIRHRFIGSLSNLIQGTSVPPQAQQAIDSKLVYTIGSAIASLDGEMEADQLLGQFMSLSVPSFSALMKTDSEVVSKIPAHWINSYLICNLSATVPESLMESLSLAVILALRFVQESRTDESIQSLVFDRLSSMDPSQFLLAVQIVMFFLTKETVVDRSTEFELQQSVSWYTTLLHVCYVLADFKQLDIAQFLLGHPVFLSHLLQPVWSKYLWSIFVEMLPHSTTTVTHSVADVRTFTPHPVLAPFTRPYTEQLLLASLESSPSPLVLSLLIDGGLDLFSVEQKQLVWVHMLTIEDGTCRRVLLQLLSTTPCKALLKSRQDLAYLWSLFENDSTNLELNSLIDKLFSQSDLDVSLWMDDLAFRFLLESILNGSSSSTQAMHIKWSCVLLSRNAFLRAFFIQFVSDRLAHSISNGGTAAKKRKASVEEHSISSLSPLFHGIVVCIRVGPMTAMLRDIVARIGSSMNSLSRIDSCTASERDLLILWITKCDPSMDELRKLFSSICPSKRMSFGAFQISLVLLDRMESKDRLAWYQVALLTLSDLLHQSANSVKPASKESHTVMFHAPPDDSDHFEAQLVLRLVKEWPKISGMEGASASGTAILAPADLFKFCKNCLKYRFNSPVMIHLVSLLASHLPNDSVPKSVQFSASTLFQLIVSHSQFGELMQAQTADLTTESIQAVSILQLICALIHRDKSLLNRHNLSLFLTFYNASLSMKDRMIRMLLTQMESNAIYSAAKGVLWGLAARQASALATVPSTREFLYEKTVETHRMRITADCFPIYRELTSEQLAGSDAELLQWDFVDPWVTKQNLEPDMLNQVRTSESWFIPSKGRVDSNSGNRLTFEQSHLVYDPSFVIPWFFHVVQSMDFDPRKFVDLGCLSLVIRGLSSECTDMRLMCSRLLTLYFNFVDQKDIRFREKAQILLVLRSLRDSIETLATPVANVITMFVSHSTTLMLRPDNIIFPLVNRFLLQRPYMDLSDIPMFFSSFFSGSENLPAERSWIIQILSGGLLTNSDVRLYHRRHILEILLSFVISPLCDAQMREKVCQLIEKLVKLSKGLSDLTQHLAFVSWIHSLSENHILYLNSIRPNHTHTASAAVVSASPGSLVASSTAAAPVSVSPFVVCLSSSSALWRTSSPLQWLLQLVSTVSLKYTVAIRDQVAAVCSSWIKALSVQHHHYALQGHDPLRTPFMRTQRANVASPNTNKSQSGQQTSKSSSILDSISTLLDILIVCTPPSVSVLTDMFNLLRMIGSPLSNQIDHSIAKKVLQLVSVTSPVGTVEAASLLAVVEWCWLYIFESYKSITQSPLDLTVLDGEGIESALGLLRWCGRLFKHQPAFMLAFKSSAVLTQCFLKSYSLCYGNDSRIVALNCLNRLCLTMVSNHLSGNPSIQASLMSIMNQLPHADDAESLDNASSGQVMLHELISLLIREVLLSTSFNQFTSLLDSIENYLTVADGVSVKELLKYKVPDSQVDSSSKKESAKSKNLKKAKKVKASQ